MKEYIGTGKTVDEAIADARQGLNAPAMADVKIEVIQMPKKKTLGLFGGRGAKVRASYEEPKKKEKKKNATKKTASQKEKKKTSVRSNDGSNDEKLNATANGKTNGQRNEQRTGQPANEHGQGTGRSGQRTGRSGRSGQNVNATGAKGAEAKGTAKNANGANKNANGAGKNANSANNGANNGASNNSKGANGAGNSNADEAKGAEMIGKIENPVIKKPEPKKAEPKHTEPLNINTDGAVEYFYMILNAMKISDVEVTPQIEGDSLHLKVECEDAGIIIGKRGETLEALQYLISLVLKKQTQKYVRVVIEVGDYRERRDETLRRLARKNANYVARSGKKFTFEPMNPYERRIIHTTVQEVDGVESASIGHGDNRRVVLTPTGGVRNTRRGGNSAPKRPATSDRENAPRYGKIAPPAQNTETADSTEGETAEE